MTMFRLKLYRCALHRLRKTRPALGFTLVEVLIVLTLILVLAGIALPLTKDLLSDQKASRVARSIAAYFNEARGEALARGQYVGVRIERLAATNNVEFGSSASLRLRRITGVPPYSGEAANARVEMRSISSGIATVWFEEGDNMLLRVYIDSGFDPDAPISDGDLMELPGGRLYPLDLIGVVEDPPGSGINYISAQIDLNTPEDPANGSSTRTFPLGHRVPATGKFKYRIYRKPSVSATNPLSFARGVALDLNYSGVGLNGYQFEPAQLTAPAVNQPIDILFGPSGRVEYVSTDSIGNRGPAIGMIYLCLGTTDGVVELSDPSDANKKLNELFEQSDQFTANGADLDSIWIVINPNTGRVVTSPFASINFTPSSLEEALAATRGLAILSDTLDSEP